MLMEERNPAMRWKKMSFSGLSDCTAANKQVVPGAWPSTPILHICQGWGPRVSTGCAEATAET